MGNLCNALLENTSGVAFETIEDKEGREVDQRPLSTRESLEDKAERAKYEDRLNERLERIDLDEDLNDEQPVELTELNKLDVFRKLALRKHNEYRKRHKAPPLKLNPDLCKLAQTYAQDLANKDYFAHSLNKWEGNLLGESMAIMIGKELTGIEMTDIFYAEKDNYDFDKPGFKDNSAYFSQLVWTGTTDVGFGLGQGPDEKWIGIANYHPIGNTIGKFEENVFKESS